MGWHLFDLFKIKRRLDLPAPSAGVAGYFYKLGRGEGTGDVGERRGGHRAERLCRNHPSAEEYQLRIDTSGGATQLRLLPGRSIF